MQNKQQISQKDFSGKRLFDLLFVISFGLFILLFLSDPAGLQKNVIFQRGNDLLADFLNSVRHIAKGNPYADGHIQPPLVFLMLYPFKYFADFSQELTVLWKSPKAIFAAILFVILSECFFFCMLKRYLKNDSVYPVLLYLLFSGINIYSMERGTAAIISAGCIAGFLACCNAAKKGRRIFGCFLLAAAFALKIYPALFGVILIKRRDWAMVLWSIFFGLLLTFPLFFFFEGGLENIPLLLKNLQSYRNDYSLTNWNLRVIHIFTDGNIRVEHQIIFAIIRHAADILLFTCCTAAFFSRKEDLLIFGIASIIFLSPAGADYYTMLYFAVPFITAYKNNKCNNFIIFCYFLLLTPLRFAMDFNDLLYPILPCAMMIYGLCKQIKQKDFCFCLPANSSSL